MQGIGREVLVAVSAATGLGCRQPCRQSSLPALASVLPIASPVQIVARSARLRCCCLTTCDACGSRSPTPAAGATHPAGLLYGLWLPQALVSVAASMHFFYSEIGIQDAASTVLSAIGIQDACGNTFFNYVLLRSLG
jgi:hypothetical protein